MVMAMTAILLCSAGIVGDGEQGCATSMLTLRVAHAETIDHVGKDEDACEACRRLHRSHCSSVSDSVNSCRQSSCLSCRNSHCFHGLGFVDEVENDDVYAPCGHQTLSKRAWSLCARGFDATAKSEKHKFLVTTTRTSPFITCTLMC